MLVIVMSLREKFISLIFKGVNSEPKQVSILAVHRGLQFHEFVGENNLVISLNNQFLENFKQNILNITNLHCIGLGRVPTGQPDMSGRQSNKKYCTQKKIHKQPCKNMIFHH